MATALHGFGGSIRIRIWDGGVNVPEGRKERKAHRMGNLPRTPPPILWAFAFFAAVMRRRDLRG